VLPCFEVFQAGLATAFLGGMGTPTLLRENNHLMLLGNFAVTGVACLLITAPRLPFALFNCVAIFLGSPYVAACHCLRCQANLSFAIRCRQAAHGYNEHTL
jgi:hypothetical protein